MDPKDSKGLQIALNASKLVQIAPNSSNWHQIGPNWSKCFQMGKMSPNGSKRMKIGWTIVQNCLKLAKTAKNCSTLSKIVKVGLKWYKIIIKKMVQNGPIWYNIILYGLIWLKCYLEGHLNGSGVTRSSLYNWQFKNYWCKVCETEVRMEPFLPSVAGLSVLYIVSVQIVEVVSPPLSLPFMTHVNW